MSISNFSKYLVLACVVISASTALSVNMPEREKAFVNDYDSLFNKYPEFDSYTFKMGKEERSTKSIKMDIITNPPLIPDNKIYYIHGFIKKAKNNAYINEVTIGNNKYYFLFLDKIETSRGKENIKQLRINGGVSVIGRYIRLAPYTTVFGEEKQMPVFEALHVEPCKPSKYLDKYHCAIYD